MSVRRRVTAVIAGVAALALTLTGCLYSQIPPTAPDTGVSPAPVTDGVAEDLLPYYAQTLEWQDCGGTGFDCATVTAPRDWTDPSAGDLELAVVRHRATSGQPLGSLLTNPGGPGASGVSIVRDSLSFVAGEPLTRDFDVIGFDPRGVGDSTAVRCYEGPELDAYLYDIAPGERGSDEWTEALGARNTAFAQACEDNSDGILPYITTENAARDMDLLRGVLGDEKLNYLGYSYGTFLGATYAKLFPERVGRMVLDGAVDPSVPSSEVGVSQAIGFEASLRTFMADCLQNAGCPFGGSVDDALDDLSALLARTDARPLTAADGRRMGADSLMTAIIAALYSPDSWPFLRSALAGAADGQADVAFQLADLYNGRVNGVYQDNSTEAFRAYNCMDYPDDMTEADEAALQQRLEQDAPVSAPYWLTPDVCEAWPYPPSGTRGAITAEGTPPIVVVGSTGDPATPYAWAESLAAQLDQGVLVTRVGEGHLGYNRGNACVDAAIEAFLIDDTVPENGLRCG